MCKKLIFSILTLVGIFAFSSSIHAQVDGKALFKEKCASCHATDMKKNLTGPALGGVQERWSEFSQADLYEWIRNSSGLIAKDHPRASQLWKEWGPTVMNPFPELKDEEIAELLVYINDVYTCTGKYSETAPSCKTDAPELGATNNAGSRGIPTGYVFALLFVLGLLALLLARVNSNMDSLAEAKEKNTVAKRKSLMEVLTSTHVVMLIAFALTLLGGYWAVNNAINVNRQQGYQPTQPIAFSHELHAGINKIDCQYCHDGARRSKHAVIPAVNTCMNCHKAINEGPKYGKEEIAKIYAAAGWDPDKKVYTGNTKPIEWVRIHNLPDHVYFNHAQHVVAGKVECQTCHGPVEKMEELYQYSPLSMGWCINCHRETEVQFADNDYYKAYQQYHDDLKSGKMKKVTVEDIGGLECQKCHY